MAVPDTVVHIIVRTSVGWESQICNACGKPRTDFVEIHLRHTGQKILLCAGCDDAQLAKPRPIVVQSER